VCCADMKLLRVLWKTYRKQLILNVLKIIIDAYGVEPNTNRTPKLCLLHHWIICITSSIIYIINHYILQYILTSM